MSLSQGTETSVKNLRSGTGTSMNERSVIHYINDSQSSCTDNTITSIVNLNERSQS